MMLWSAPCAVLCRRRHGISGWGSALTPRRTRCPPGRPWSSTRPAVVVKAQPDGSQRLEPGSLGFVPLRSDMEVQMDPVLRAFLLRHALEEEAGADTVRIPAGRDVGELQATVHLSHVLLGDPVAVEQLLDESEVALLLVAERRCPEPRHRVGIGAVECHLHGGRHSRLLSSEPKHRRRLHLGPTVGVFVGGRRRARPRLGGTASPADPVRHPHRDANGLAPGSEAAGSWSWWWWSGRPPRSAAGCSPRPGTART